MRKNGLGFKIADRKSMKLPILKIGGGGTDEIAQILTKNNKCYDAQVP